MSNYVDISQVVNNESKDFSYVNSFEVSGSLAVKPRMKTFRGTEINLYNEYVLDVGIDFLASAKANRFIELEKKSLKGFYLWFEVVENGKHIISNIYESINFIYGGSSLKNGENRIIEGHVMRGYVEDGVFIHAIVKFRSNSMPNSKKLK
jgi:hypothetical protein